ncbi:MAG: hypothetical protein ACK5H2_11195 [Beutenbergiaceae bacterium]
MPHSSRLNAREHAFGAPGEGKGKGPPTTSQRALRVLGYTQREIT